MPPKDSEVGFTLTELLVVMGIIAVLTGVAAAAFIGARNRAHDAAAQSTLREAILAGALVLHASETVIPAQPLLMAELTATEPDIEWKDPGQNAETGEVSVARDASFVYFASASATSECHYVRLQLNGTLEKHHSPGANCVAQDGASIPAWLGW